MCPHKQFSNKQMGIDYEFERITTGVYPFLKGHALINNINGLLLNYLYLSDVKDWGLLKRLKI